jgi:hypothetical protein
LSLPNAPLNVATPLVPMEFTAFARHCHQIREPLTLPRAGPTALGPRHEPLNALPD